MTIFNNPFYLLPLLACIFSISLPNRVSGEERGPFRKSYVFMTATNKETGVRKQMCVNYQQFQLPNTSSDVVGTHFDTAKPFTLLFWRGVTNATKLCPLPSPRDPQVQYHHGIVPLDYRITDDGTACTRQFSGRTGFLNASQFSVDVLKEHTAGAALLVLDRARQFTTNWKDYLWSEFYDPHISGASSIPTFYIYRTDFYEKVMGVSANVDDDEIEIRFHRPDAYPVDVSMLVIWMIAMTCVTVGGLWAHFRHRAGKDVPIVPQPTPDAETESTRGGGARGEQEETAGKAEVEGEGEKERHLFLENYGNAVVIVVMMVALCAVLLIGYFFRPFLDISVTFFNVTLVFFGTASIYGIIRGVISVTRIADYQWYNARMTWTPSVFCMTKKYTYSATVITLVSFSFCATWFFTRRAPHAYIQLDVINMALCMHVLKCLRLPSLKWITILMACMFFYDAFMVFGTQYITPNGCSVMLEVATGVSACSRSSDVEKPGNGYPVAPCEQLDRPEKFPMLMQVAHFDPMNECLEMDVELNYQTTILGLGDIVMPGYLVAHCFTMSGFSNGVRLLYGTVSIVGYGLGLIATFVALSVAQVAQPALIYLVPFTILPIMGVASLRGEFKKIWTGAPPDTQILVEENSPDVSGELMDDLPPNVIVTTTTENSESATATTSFSNPLNNSGEKSPKPEDV